MNKNIVIGIVVILTIFGAGMFSANQQSQNPKSVETAQKGSSSRQDSAEQGSSTSSQNQNLDNNSKYIEYSRQAFDQAKGSRRVLYFYASWCPTCRIADPDLSTNSNKFPEDVIVLRVNYNDPDTDQEEKDLAKKYAITYQHTFVQIDGSGNEVTKWNGGKTEELLANIK